MKKVKAQQLLSSYKKHLELTNDAVFMIHFSEEDDQFYGINHNLDTLDLGIVINQFFIRLAMSVEDADDAPAFIHYGLAKDVRDKCNEIMQSIERDIK